MAPFAIVDRDREGIDAVLMIVDDQAEAELIAIELRRAGIRADIVPAAPDYRRR